MNSSGHPFGPGPTATIREDSERADAWRVIFGGLTAPIRTAMPRWYHLPSCGPALAYDLDMSRLDAATMDRLVEYTRDTFVPGESLDTVRAGLLNDGMPIKADDVATVTNEHPTDLFRDYDDAAQEAVRASFRLPATMLIGESMNYATAEAALDFHKNRTLRRCDGSSLSQGHDFYETPDHVRRAALDAVLGGIADRMDAQAGVPTYDIPEGAQVQVPGGELTDIPAGHMTIEQIAAISGGKVISPGIIGVSLQMPNAKSTVRFTAEDRAFEALGQAADAAALLRHQLEQAATNGCGKTHPAGLTCNRKNHDGDPTGHGEQRGRQIIVWHADESDVLYFYHDEDSFDDPIQIGWKDGQFAGIADRFIDVDYDDVRSELSEADGPPPPPLCSCLPDGDPLGPLCQRSRDVAMIKTPRPRLRRHGGTPKCARTCSECPNGAHHFSSIDMQYIIDGDEPRDDADETDELRKHPAALAGCMMWYECRHCSAWMEADDSDDDIDDEDDEDDEDDDAPDSDDFDDDWDDDWCDGCGNDIDDCECDESDDSSPHSAQLGLAFSSVLAEHPTNEGHTAFPDVAAADAANHPPDILALAESIILAARFCGLVQPERSDDSALIAHWTGAIAQWPADVRSSVDAWSQRVRGEKAPSSVPPAVLAMAEQARANGAA